MSLSGETGRSSSRTRRGDRGVNWKDWPLLLIAGAHSILTSWMFCLNYEEICGKVPSTCFRIRDVDVPCYIFASIAVGIVDSIALTILATRQDDKKEVMSEPKV